MYGDDYEYASTRLSNTVVRTKKGTPVLVHTVDRLGKAHVRTIKTGRSAQVKMSNLNTKPIKLGYVNRKDGSVYISRVPARSGYKQGISLGSLRMFGVSANGRLSPEALDILLCCKGDYPSLQEAIEKAKEVGSCAWSKSWCVNNHGDVFYRFGTRVGHIVGGRVVLLDRYKHLETLL